MAKPKNYKGGKQLASLTREPASSPKGGKQGVYGGGQSLSHITNSGVKAQSPRGEAARYPSVYGGGKKVKQDMASKTKKRVRGTGDSTGNEQTSSP